MGNELLISGELELKQGVSAQNVFLHFGVPVPFAFKEYIKFPLLSTEILPGKLYWDSEIISNAILVPGQKPQFHVKTEILTQPGSYLLYYSLHCAGLTQQFSFLPVTVIPPPSANLTAVPLPFTPIKAVPPPSPIDLRAVPPSAPKPNTLPPPTK
jgi:hypothetical protein